MGDAIRTFVQACLRRLGTAARQARPAPIGRCDICDAAAPPGDRTCDACYHDFNSAP